MMVSFWISGLFSGSTFSRSSETLQYLTITKWKNPKEDHQLLNNCCKKWKTYIRNITL